MNIELYSHQEQAVEELGNGKILAGDVGSGKSRAALVYYYTKVCGGKLKINGQGEARRMRKPKNLYIITTAKKRDSNEWEGEYASMGLSKAPTTNVDGVCVVTDSWNNIKRYTDVKDSFFIFDEQRLVGHGVWVRSFLKIVKNRKNDWILLTATPGDTWLDYTAVFVANGFYKNRTEYLRRHVEYEPWSKFPKVKTYHGTATLEKFRNQILVPMSFERNTIRHRVNLYSDWNKAKLKVALADHWDPFKNEPITDVASFGYICRRVVNEDPSRLELVTKVLMEKKRAIIFYNFDYELEMLRKLDGVDGMVIGEWNGHKHDPIPKGDLWAYLVQYTAGSEGWNCVDTDTVIFYSLNYSYKTIAQAEGRIDRLNTGYRDLWYFYVRSHSSIDMAIGKAIEKKEDFNKKAFYDRYFGEN